MTSVQAIETILEHYEDIFVDETEEGAQSWREMMITFWCGMIPTYRLIVQAGLSRGLNEAIQHIKYGIFLYRTKYFLI